MAWVNVGVAAVGVAGSIAKSKIEADSRKAGGMMGGMNSSPDFRTTEAVFDNSGWNVSFGNSKIDSTASKTTTQSGASAPGSGIDAGMGNSLLPSLGSLGQVDQSTLIYGGVGLLALMMLRKRK